MATKKPEAKASTRAKAQEGIERRAGDSDGGDQPCLYCSRNPTRHEQEYFDNVTGRYVCDMCALSRYRKGPRFCGLGLV
jgi:hypothetical protein